MATVSEPSVAAGAERPPVVRRVLPLLFYGGLLVLLLGVLLTVWQQVLPGPVASRVGHNTEGYLLALVLAAWIQYVRPRLARSALEVPLTAAAALVALAAALGLLASGWDSRFVTLNEPLVALAVLLPYAQLRGVWSRRMSVALPAAALLLMLVGAERNELVTDQAESLGFVLLVPLTMGLVDSGVLDPRSTTRAPVRWGWYVTMLVLPVLLSVLEYQVGVGGAAGTATRFGVRIAESFIGTLLLSAYFAVGLGWTGRRR